MMPVWEKLDFYKIEIQNAQTTRETIKKKLIVLVEPPPVIELTRENTRAQVIEDVEKCLETFGNDRRIKFNGSRCG